MRDELGRIRARQEERQNCCLILSHQSQNLQDGFSGSMHLQDEGKGIYEGEDLGYGGHPQSWLAGVLGNDVATAIVQLQRVTL